MNADREGNEAVVLNNGHGLPPNESKDHEHVGVFYDESCFEALSFNHSEWYYLPKRKYQTATGKLVVHNGLLYTCDKDSHVSHSVVSVLDDGSWRDLTTINGVKFQVLSHGQFIYLFNCDQEEVSRFDPMQTPPRIERLQFLVPTPTHIISFEGNILIFSSLMKNSVQTTPVYSWNTADGSCSRLNNFQGSAEHMTSFKNSQDVYIIESNGNMWKIVQNSGVIGFEFLKKIFNDKRELRGAYLLDKTLTLFGDAPTEDSSSNGYGELFVYIDYFGLETETSNFVHFLCNKKLLIRRSVTNILKMMCGIKVEGDKLVNEQRHILMNPNPVSAGEAAIAVGIFICLILYFYIPWWLFRFTNVLEKDVN